MLGTHWTLTKWKLHIPLLFLLLIIKPQARAEQYENIKHCFLRHPMAVSRLCLSGIIWVLKVTRGNECSRWCTRSTPRCPPLADVFLPRPLLTPSSCPLPQSPGLGPRQLSYPGAGFSLSSAASDWQLKGCLRPKPARGIIGAPEHPVGAEPLNRLTFFSPLSSALLTPPPSAKTLVQESLSLVIS